MIGLMPPPVEVEASRSTRVLGQLEISSGCTTLMTGWRHSSRLSVAIVSQGKYWLTCTASVPMQ